MSLTSVLTIVLALGGAQLAVCYPPHDKVLRDDLPELDVGAIELSAFSLSLRDNEDHATPTPYPPYSSYFSPDSAYSSFYSPYPSSTSAASSSHHNHIHTPTTTSQPTPSHHTSDESLTPSPPSDIFTDYPPSLLWPTAAPPPEWPPAKRQLADDLVPVLDEIVSAAL